MLDMIIFAICIFIAYGFFSWLKKKRKPLTVDEELFYAVDDNDLQRVQKLVAGGSDVNTKVLNRQAPLYVAAQRGYVHIAKVLISNGAKLDIKNSYGGTPLHEAVLRGHKEMVELLLSAGADIYAKNKYGATPLDCNRKKRKDIAKLITKAHEKTVPEVCTRWQDFVAEMSEQPFDVLKTVTIKTTIYYLELEKNYREQFKDKASLLAAAGVLDSQQYIFVDEKINVPEIIEFARASAEQDDSLANFVTLLVIKFFQVYRPKDAIAAKRACLEEKMQTLADVVQIRNQYNNDPFIVKEVSGFMESPYFSETRKQLGIR